LRCFIAFFVPEPARTQVVELQGRLRHTQMLCKMVEPENIHVNLSFLGDVDESEANRAGTALEEICKRHKRFSIEVGALKMIPNERRPRVVVLAVSDESGTLKNLSSEIKKSISGDSKPPHITLCRVKSLLDGEATVSKINRMAAESKIDGFEVGSIDLVMSQLGRDGPVYSIVKKCEFQLG